VRNFGLAGKDENAGEFTTPSTNLKLPIAHYALTVIGQEKFSFPSRPIMGNGEW